MVWDAGATDAGAPATSDAMPEDSEAPLDVGSPLDAATTDAAPTDGGPTDGGPTDAVAADVGSPLDAGPDAGQVVDAGAPPLRLQTEFGDPNVMEVRTSGIWAIWWYPQFDHAADAQWLITRLDEVRDLSLNDFGMQDPPNPGRGVFYNVYIHHGADDPFPTGWANGQGTDRFGNPFLTLPNGAHLDPGNVDHEGFHVFQYSADSPGFAYSGDSQWYIESTAQWFGATRSPTDINTFVEAGAIDGNPHLALWHSFSNEAPGDATDWMFQVRQYGMHTYLYYLTEVAGVSRDVITAGFFGGVQASPQRYHFDRLGQDGLRRHFADWAARNTADFDYLTRDQVRRARLEVQNVGDPNNNNPYVAEYIDQGTRGWVRPPDPLKPRSWAYNVIKVTNTSSASYGVHLRADAGPRSPHFEARLIVMTPGGPAFSDVVMTSPLAGSITTDVTAAVDELYFVVVSVPEHFSGYESYGYEYRITRR